MLPSTKSVQGHFIATLLFVRIWKSNILTKTNIENTVFYIPTVTIQDVEKCVGVSNNVKMFVKHIMLNVWKASLEIMQCIMSW